MDYIQRMALQIVRQRIDECVKRHRALEALLDQDRLEEAEFEAQTLRILVSMQISALKYIPMNSCVDDVQNCHALLDAFTDALQSIALTRLLRRINVQWKGVV